MDISSGVPVDSAGYINCYRIDAIMHFLVHSYIINA